MASTTTQTQSDSGSPRTSNVGGARPLFDGDKERYVRDMFAAIAPKYDRLNSILSFSQHRRWRRLAVRLAGVRDGDRCVDICSGTGDFAVDLARAAGRTGRVVGSDFCEPMVRQGLAKTGAARGAPIEMMIGNAEALRMRMPASTSRPWGSASETSRTSSAR